MIDEPVRHWGEDTHAGFALHQAGIELFHDRRFIYNPYSDPFVNRSKLSIHLCDRGSKWNPDVMYKTHLREERDKLIMPNWTGICKRCGNDKLSRNVHFWRCAKCGDMAA